MDAGSAVLLGVVQGLTEFLPVSSSGHLVIGQALLGWNEPSIFFDVALHVGTLIAVLIVFRQEIWDITMGAVRLPFNGGLKDAQKLGPRERLFIFVVVGTIPIVLLGLFARKYIVQLFGSTTVVCFNLLITGTILWLTRYATTQRPRTLERMGIRDALIIGLAQSFAIMPGISRSGATISTGIYLGLDRELAGKFSFLLFTPAVIGAIILESTHITLTDIQLVPTLLGLLSGAVVGYVALNILLKLVRRGSLHVFAPYCWLLGVIGLAAQFLL